MAFDYNEITEAQTNPGAPGTSSLWKRWWKNPIAMMLGAPGAPRLAGDAVGKLTDLPVLTVAASDDASLAFSNSIVVGLVSTVNTANPPAVVARRVTIVGVTGVIRLRASHFTQSGGGTNSRMSLYKNNVLVQAYATTSNAAVARVNDVSVVPGDVLEWRIGAESGTFSSNFAAAAETASDSYVQAIPLRRASTA